MWLNRATELGNRQNMALQSRFMHVAQDYFCDLLIARRAKQHEIGGRFWQDVAHPELHGFSTYTDGQSTKLHCGDPADTLLLGMLLGTA